MNTSQSHTCVHHQPQRKVLRTRCAAALYLSALLWFSLGCLNVDSGWSWNAAPGQDTFLGDEPHFDEDNTNFGSGVPGKCDWTGAVAVDPTTNTTFVQQTVVDVPCAHIRNMDDTIYTTRRTLFAIPPDSPMAVMVLDTSDTTHLRLAFGQERIVLAGKKNGAEQLTYLDRHNFKVLAQHRLTHQSGAPQTSPSGRYVLLKPMIIAGPAYLIDTQSMTETHIFNKYGALEASWSPVEDRLIVVHSTTANHRGVEVQSWDMEEHHAGHQGLPDFDQQPSTQVELRGLWNNVVLDYTTMRIRPDGQEVALYLYSERGELVLVRINPNNGHFQTHTDVLREMLRYSSDNTHLVTQNVDGQLMIINTRNNSVRIPMQDPSAHDLLYITADGTRALSTSPNGKVLQITELDSGRVDTIALTHNGALKQLVEIEARSEIWSVGGAMGVFHLEDAKLETFTMGWHPEHINYLPGQDLMVLDDRQKNRLIFLDPTTKAIVREVTLPLDGIQRYPLGSEADIERTTDARPQTFTKPETRPRRF